MVITHKYFKLLNTDTVPGQTFLHDAALVQGEVHTQWEGKWHAWVSALQYPQRPAPGLGGRAAAASGQLAGRLHVARGLFKCRTLGSVD